MADKDSTSNSAKRGTVGKLVNPVAPEQAPIWRRVVRGTGGTAAMTLGAAGLVVGGLAGGGAVVSEIAQHSSTILAALPYAGTGVGTAAVAGISVAATRSGDGTYTTKPKRSYEAPAKSSAEFHSMLRRTRIKSWAVTAALVGAGVAAKVTGVDGGGIAEHVLMYGAAASGGVGVTTAIGSAVTRRHGSAGRALSE